MAKKKRRSIDYGRVVDVGSEKQVFVNQWLIYYGRRERGIHGTSQNTELKPRFTKWPKGINLSRVDPQICPEPMIVADKPWESFGLGSYTSVIIEPDKYLLYYGAYTLEENKNTLDMEEDPETVLSNGIMRDTVCMAESTDGIHWKKPNLGFVA